LPTAGLVPVPSLWRGIGVEEDRQFITDFSQPPYDALVQVKAQGGSCSGAVVGAPTLVVTAGHCIDKTDRKGKVQVIVERSATHKEVIPATWVSYQHKGGADWAILRLRKAPATPVTPLAFADSFDASKSAQLNVAAIGYPGDLFKLSGQAGLCHALAQAVHPGHQPAQLQRPATDPPVQPLLQHLVRRLWRSPAGVEPRQRPFELLGVHAGVDDGFEGTHRKTLFSDSRFRALMYKTYQDVEVPLLGNRQQALDKAAYFRPAQQADKDNPGVSTVARAYRERVESLYFDRSTLSLALIETLRQQAGQGHGWIPPTSWVSGPRRRRTASRRSGPSMKPAWLAWPPATRRCCAPVAPACAMASRSICSRWPGATTPW
jgi:hypothetical protein